MSTEALASTMEPQGPDAWLRKAAFDPLEQMPLFAESMGNAADLWTESFCAFAATEGEVVFDGLRSGGAADLLEPAAPILAALRIQAWHCAAALALDRTAVSTVVDAFFGGGEEEAELGNRPLSAIETRIVDVLAGQAASALTGAMKAVHPTRVDFDRTLVKPDTSFLGKPPPPLLIAGFVLRTVGRSARFGLAFPLAAVQAQGAAWGGDAALAPVPDKTVWSRSLETEVSRAALRLQAGIEAQPMSLRAVASLRVGQVLELPTAAASRVVVNCGDERLFRCHLGQSEGFYTIRIDEPLERRPQPPRKDR